MKDRDKTREQLISKVTQLRQRIAELEAAEAERVRTETALREVGLEITAQLDLNALLHSIASWALETLGGIAAGMCLYRPEHDVLETIAIVGEVIAPIGSTMRRGESLSGRVWAKGEAVVVEDYRCWEGRIAAYRELPIGAMVGVPICWGETFLGVLSVVSDAPYAFTQADAELLNLLATQSAIAIRKARLYEATQRDAAANAALLHEVNHRVTNNLTAIMGLLTIEQSRTDVGSREDYQAILRDLVSRVQGLARVHCMLSSSEWAPLRLSDLAEQVIELALQALPLKRNVSVEIVPSPVRVTARQANDLALVVNELTTNSVKYAWPARQAGRIVVRIEREEDVVLFEFRDDGVGYPEEVLRLAHHNIGWGLIKSIVEQGLGGEVSLHNDQGAAAIIRFSALASNAVGSARVSRTV